MPPRPSPPGCGCLLPLILVFVSMTQAPHPLMVFLFLGLLGTYVFLVRDYRAKMRLWQAMEAELLRRHYAAAASEHAQSTADAYRRAQHAAGRAAHASGAAGYRGAGSGHSGSQGGRSGPVPQPRPSQPSPYEVLQVPAGADAATIRAAYRKLAVQYHPDKVANLGPEFKALAEEKMKEINAAYARLRQQ